MQGGRGRGDPFFNFGDPFAGFGGFGDQRSLFSNFMGGRDPFDDPFFTRPFGSMFGPSMFPSIGSPFPNVPTGSPFQNMPTGFIDNQVPQPNRSRGPVIEEINSDDESDGTEGNPENFKNHGRQSNTPYVQHPDDEAEGRNNRAMQYRNEYTGQNNSQQVQPQGGSFSFHSSSVTYGGPNGAYYTSSRTKRMGSDGVMIDESKEADATTGEASHMLARGIREKVHSTTRKLNAGGQVNTMQTLHNLNEDELPGFDEVWKENARKHLPGWNEGFSDPRNIGSSRPRQNSQASERGWALPSTNPSKKVKPDNEDVASSSRSQKSSQNASFMQNN